MVDDRQAYLGTGWGFPPTFDKATRQVELVNGVTDIFESLSILLTTSVGERVMQPTYGCNLTELLFEPLSPSVASHVKELIRTAILYNEPRIRLEALDLSLNQQLEGVVDIQIDFTVLSTNSRFSFVYPFYLQEGAGLR
jgi:uncharacterized protein